MILDAAFSSLIRAARTIIRPTAAVADDLVRTVGDDVARAAGNRAARAAETGGRAADDAVAGARNIDDFANPHLEHRSPQSPRIVDPHDEMFGFGDDLARKADAPHVNWADDSGAVDRSANNSRRYGDGDDPIGFGDGGQWF